MNDEGLTPQYNVGQSAWAPFADCETLTVAGDHGWLHTVGGRWVDSNGDLAAWAGTRMLQLALDTTGPVIRARNAIEVRRFKVATFRFKSAWGDSSSGVRASTTW